MTPTSASPTRSPDMSASISASVAASVAVLRAEARLFRREPASLFWVVAFPLLLLVLVGLVPSNRAEGSAPEGARIIDLYVPVIVLLGLIMAGIQSMPPVLTSYREQGILRRMSTTPVRPVSLLASQVIVHGVASLAAGMLAIALGRLLYGVALPANIPGYTVTLVLVALGALVMGALIAALSRTAKACTAAATIIFFPLIFTAGVYVPVQAMPETMRRIVEFTPFGAASQALDQASSGAWPSLPHLTVVLAWTVILAGASARWFRWE
ncbi:ABC transporter permease [Streptomyces sp. NPDC052236]|uniref:ABC transporter permease n=1 Tax=Streptomyces sp. NPDC052236 TaxID=3365686 RepID=UPI0037D93288